MNRKNLSVWLKVMIICVGVCGALIYAVVLPMISSQIEPFAENMSAKYLWLGFLWLTGVPCYAVLVLSWHVAANIGRERSFVKENADHLKYISVLASADTAFLFIGNVILFLLGKNNVAMMAFCMLVIFLGVVISVAFAALSHLVLNAAELQEQCDLTI